MSSYENKLLISKHQKAPPNRSPRGLLFGINPQTHNNAYLVGTLAARQYVRVHALGFYGFCSYLINCGVNYGMTLGINYLSGCKMTLILCDVLQC